MAKKVKDEYVADAKDGDGDGKVQDGTIFERPEGVELTPRQQEMLKIIAEEN